MHQSLAIKLCKGLVALVMTTSAYALGPQFEASMNWGSFEATLFDLDPNDAVTPSLQWTSQTTGASVLMNGTLFTATPANDFTSLVSVDDGLRFAGGDASVISASGSGLDQTLFFLEINAARYGKFTLSPKTRVDFTLPVSASALGIPSGISFLGGMYMSADFTSFDSADITEGQTISGRILSVTFANPDTVEAVGVSFSSGIIINANPVPVPEPGVWVLMFAGLGLIATGSMRRRSR